MAASKQESLATAGQTNNNSIYMGNSSLDKGNSLFQNTLEDSKSINIAENRQSINLADQAEEK